MLFNSYPFLFVFLPLTLLFFYRVGAKWAPTVLIFASLCFYSYWNFHKLNLLIISVVVNFYLGRVLEARNCNTKKASLGRVVMWLAIALNLATLGYYKYWGFIIQSVNEFAGMSLSAPQIVLPLAISFFTFTQIAYLIDAYGGQTEKYSFSNYLLFISTFPHLIAGPIVHHYQLMPQFKAKNFAIVDSKNVAAGVSLFIAGLGKKVLIADYFAGVATPVFRFAAESHHLGRADAWLGVLAYTIQLYFDFSGYSDMAVGLGLMFNMRLPVNFLSPYQAANVSEFWRRWHITLSDFLRNYVYTPLALSGYWRGEAGAFFNLFVTMVLGGIWHGAGFNFIIWGALHGGYLVIYQIWSTKLANRISKDLLKSWPARALAHGMTLAAVLIGWVFFRAANSSIAVSILKSMLRGENGAAMVGIQAWFVWLAVFGALIWVFIAPNTVWWLSGEKLGLEFDRRLQKFVWAPNGFRWQATSAWAVTLSAVLILSLMMMATGASEFLYFQF